jgi:ABC-type antimicrobial peptide transport system permease subunit
MALGARPGQILMLVLREGAQVTAAGVLLGLAAALAATRALGTLLFGVSSSDAMTFTAAALMLSAVTVLATLLPARRALRVDPMMALRDE